MKTDEQWLITYWRTHVITDDEGCPQSLSPREEFIRAIQLDAFKAGAAWAAAQEVEAYPNYITVSCLRNLLESIYDDGARDLSKKILKELEKLTEIPK